MSTMAEALKQAEQQADATTAQLERSVEELGKSVDRVIKENEALQDELVRARADLATAANVVTHLQQENAALLNAFPEYADPQAKLERDQLRARVRELELQVAGSVEGVPNGDLLGGSSGGKA